MIRAVDRNDGRPSYPDRKHTRLRGYDYTSHGAYFITVVTQDRQRILAAIGGGIASPTTLGDAVRRSWLTLPALFPGLTLDEFVLMPDHVHGIVFLDGSGVSLPRVVQSFKSFTTREYLAMVSRDERVSTRLWQRDYFDRVIRDERELDAVREYIRANPARWGTRDGDDVPRWLVDKDT